jgi:glycosyltransferase involved in cell wall biosynthesis
MRGRILVIDHKTPRPDEDSGSASALSYLTILARAGFDVTFAPNDLADDGRYTEALHALGLTTLAAPDWTSMADVINAHAPSADVVLLYRAPVAAGLFDLVRRTAPLTKILFHPVDLHFLRMQRQAELHQDADLMAQANALRAVELDLFGRADASIVVSAHEYELLHGLLPSAAIHRIPILREAPVRLPQAGPRAGVVFIGGYDHTPNVDAVRWFVREVWPILRSKGFEHRFIIAGSHVPPEIAALADDDIEVRGYVEDLAALFAECRMSVAPLRYGGGIKGKIVSSLSHGVPVVATSMAAEGMALRAGHDILVADTPEAMADEMIRLTEDDSLWQAISDNGLRAFDQTFSLASGGSAVLAVVDGLMEQRRATYVRPYTDLVRECDKLTQQRDAAITERDAARAARDISVRERNAAYAARDLAIGERDALLASRSWRAMAPIRRVRELLLR